jgi:hypothetical protein
MRAGAAVASAAVIAGVAASVTAASTPPLTVVAKDLNNPRKIFIEPSGAIDVVEAGTGGNDACLGTGPRTTCVGLTGSITRIENGRQRRVLTRLPSWATPDQRRASGAADVLVRGNTFFVLLQDALASSNGANAFGRDGRFAGDLIATASGRAAPKVIANLAAFEVTHNPDHGAGPGAKLGNPSIDSNPYAFTAFRGGFAVVDAAANDLLWINPNGKISVLAVFPTQTVKLTKAVARKIGAPPALTSLSVQSVPSSVTVGPDGALYVGELTGRPFQPGAARIWRVVPGRKPTRYASGFTTISDLAFAGDDLLVLEIATRGLLDPTSPGALIRLAPDGSRTVLATAGLVAPTGLAVSHDSIYIANDGLFPGTGPGRHGEVVRLSRP